MFRSTKAKKVSFIGRHPLLSKNSFLIFVVAFNAQVKRSSSFLVPPSSVLGSSKGENGFVTPLALPLPTSSYHDSYSTRTTLCAVERKTFDALKRKKARRGKSSKTTSLSQSHATKPKSSTKAKDLEPNLRTQLDFARDGHCVLRQAFSKQRVVQLKEQLMKYAHGCELIAWQQKVEVASQSSARAQACRSVAQCRQVLVEFGVSPDDVPFLQYFNTWRELPLVLDVARDLAQTAAVLLDCDSIRLYQDSLFWKRAGDGPTPWHTDGRMAPFDTSLLVTFWIPLQNIPPDGSALVFCSKSHSDFALPFWNEYSKTNNDPYSAWNHLDERYGGKNALVNYMPMSIGDVTAHSGWVLHCADAPAPNGEDRIALAVSFVDARAPVRRLVDSSGKNSSQDVGDPEDAWSYRDWIKQVSANQPSFHHDLVPILYRQSRSHRPRKEKEG